MNDGTLSVTDNNGIRRTAYERVLDAIDRGGGAVERHGRRASCRCPAHDDRSPSLSVTAGETRVLVHCHAGCDTDDVLAALGMTRADLFDQPLDRPAGDDWMPCAKRGHRQVAAYPYVDERGQTLFTVHRCAQKCFAQSRPDPSAKTGRRWRLRDDDGGLLVRLVPYRLPDVVSAVARRRVVWIVEGEKDVHVCRDRGLAATCNAGGAGKWREDYGRWFRGADVDVVADRDDAGERHARQVAESLLPVASSLRVLQARWGKDAADHYAAGGHSGNFVTVWEPKPYQGEPR